MPRLVLVNPEPFPLIHELLASEAAARGMDVECIPGKDWGHGVTPWLDIRGGHIRAGLTGHARMEELGPRDALWVLAEWDGTSVKDPYLRAEHEALLQGFHMLCPARSVNRKGLRGPLETMPPWVLLSRHLADTEEGPLRAPEFHIGDEPADGRNWLRWQGVAAGGARVFWHIPAPGPLHLAIIAAGRATLLQLEGEVSLVSEVPPELTAALVRFAAACHAEYLELMLARSGDEAAAWVVLDVRARPESLHALPASVLPPVREQLTALAAWLLAPGRTP